MPVILSIYFNAKTKVL